MVQLAAARMHDQPLRPLALRSFRLAQPTDVLVVEEDPSLVEVLARHFRAAGFRVRAAADGLQALFEVERRRPDLIVLDLSLPVMSGFRLVQLLKREATTSDVPVLVLTALSFQEAKEAVQAGVDDFLMRPVPPPEVVSRARQLLDRARQRQPARAAAPAA